MKNGSIRGHLCQPTPSLQLSFLLWNLQKKAESLLLFIEGKRGVYLF